MDSPGKRSFRWPHPSAAAASIAGCRASQSIHEVRRHLQGDGSEPIAATSRGVAPFPRPFWTVAAGPTMSLEVLHTDDSRFADLVISAYCRHCSLRMRRVCRDSSMETPGSRLSHATSRVSASSPARMLSRTIWSHSAHTVMAIASVAPWLGACRAGGGPVAN